MIFYSGVIFIVFSICLCSIDKRINRIHILYFQLLLLGALSFIAGGRLIGLDYEAYYEHYKALPYIWQYAQANSYMEVGYEILLSFCKTVFNSFHFFLLVFSVLTLWLALRIFSKYSPYPVLSFYMFFSYSFFTQVMGQMRQPFASLITYMVLLPLLLKRNRILACLWIITAGILFHKSILFLLFCLPIADRSLNRKSIFFFSFFAFFCYSSSAMLLEILPSLIPKNFFLYDVSIAYLTYGSYTVSFTLGMVERLFMTIILFYYSFKYSLYEKNRLLRLFVNLYFCGVCLYFAFISISADFASRGSQPFCYALFFALPMLVKEVRLRDKYILLCIIFAWTIYLSFSFLKDSHIYLPYKTILF